MTPNLRTVYLKGSKELVVFDGWFVTTAKDTVFVDILGTLNLSEANLFKKKSGLNYLLSASITKKVVWEVVPPSEDDIVYLDSPPQKKSRVILNLGAKPDDKYYYRFLLPTDEKDISFSPSFTILKSEIVEDYEPDKYIRILYASLPVKAPIALDSRKTICISPF